MADVITYYIICLSFPGPQAKFSRVFQIIISGMQLYNKKYHQKLNHC